MLWTEERKMLEYHRGRGVFYPLIQVRKPAPAAATTSLRDPPLHEGGGATSSGTTFPAMVAVVGGVLLVVFELRISLGPDAWLRALVSCAVLLLSLLSAHSMRPSAKGQKFAHGGLAAWFGSDGASPADSRAGTQREDSQPVRAFAWHPHLNMFAVALADASKSASEYVAFYDLDAEQWLQTVVKHQFQSAISCLEFQPNGGSTIAVACQEGIGIWQLEPAHHAPPHTDQTRPLDNCLSAWMSWLQLSGYRGACCISWSPCGRFLVAGYLSSNSPVVWDVCSQRPTPLQSLVPFFFFDSFGGGLEKVQWSPAGTHVLVSSRSGLLAIYETRSWSFSLHRAGAQGNKLVDARFSPNGRYLAAAVNSSEGVGELWSYAIEGRRYVSRISRKSRMFTSKSSEKPRAELEEAKRVLADRPITRIAWSATGERLAVSWGPVPGAQGTDSGVVSLMLTECDGRDQHLRVVCESACVPMCAHVKVRRGCFCVRECVCACVRTCVAFASLFVSGQCLRKLTDMHVAGLAWPDIWAACGATSIRGRSGGSRCP